MACAAACCCCKSFAAELELDIPMADPGLPCCAPPKDELELEFESLALELS